MRTLRQLACATLRKLQEKPPAQQSLAKAREYAYLHYIYFPLPLEQVRTHLLQRTESQQMASMYRLARLAEQGDRFVRTWSETAMQRGRAVTPRQALAWMETSLDGGICLDRLLGDSFVLLPAGVDVAASPAIDSRLSIHVKEAFADFLSEVLFELLSRGEAGVSHIKLLGIKRWPVRTETAIVYLPEAVPQEARRLATGIDDALRRKIDAPPGAGFYAAPPPGTQCITPGIAYSETAPGHAAVMSAGQSRAAVVAAAVWDTLTAGADLDAALDKQLADAGYAIANPAFVQRPDDAGGAVAEREAALLGAAPPRTG
ncbi:MAG TPA: T3SS effector HopA1 family protein [Noviherbaspirillum sp.]|jgi:hypothetical protein|uniref:T3SS effector HopA1 family protein n=1 Tax=Noviherbaspirillum sp. TaxID=1926288 RepID=UPI002F93022D